MSDDPLIESVEDALAAIGKEYTPPAPRAANGNGKHDAPVVFGPACRWPDDVWGVQTAGPLGDRLRTIKRAARSRQRSATAVGGVVLARVAAAIPHTIRLDNIVGSDQPLCTFGFVVGGPGTGKGDAAAIGSELLRPGSTPLLVDGINDHLPPGSGQGLIDVMFDMVDETNAAGKTVKVKRQVRNNAFFQLDEGEAMTSLAGQSSSIVLETIRTIWSGHTVGQYNVEIERRRVLPGGTYTYGIIGGIQPTKAGVILDDDEGGTPQRFLWFPSVDPELPDDDEAWPGTLDWDTPSPSTLDKIGVVGPGGYVCHYLTQAPEIAAEIKAHDRAVQRGTKALGLLDAHAMNMRRRIAGLLTILDDRTHTEQLHWELANIILDCSNAARDVVIEANMDAKAYTAKLKRAAKVADAEAIGTAEERRLVVDGARFIAGKVHAEPERWTVADMRRNGISKWIRDRYTACLDHATEEHWVVIEESDKRNLRCGEKRP